MSTVAELIVKLGLASDGFDKGLSSSQSKLQNWGTSLKSAGTKLTAGVTVPLAGAGLMAINWASALEQAEGKTEAVFQDSADAVKDWSRGTAQAYGFAQSDALAMASTYGALFKVVGMTNDVSADYSTSLIGLSADMAAFNDVSNERASQALMAGLTGEYMSLRSMGIFLNEAAVGEEALAIATADGRSEITEADKVQARYNLIMKQTAQQQGQAARESKNWSSRIPQLRAQLKNLGADLGKRLMPYALRFLDFLERAIQWFGKLSPKIQGIILVLAALAAAIGPVLLALGFMLPAIAALLPVFAALLGPLGLVILALAALVAIGIYAWTTDLWGFRDAVSAVVGLLGDFIDGLQTLGKYIRAVWEDGDTLNDWLTHFPDFLRPVIEGIGDFVNILHTFTGALSDVWVDLGDIAQAIAAGDWKEALDETKDALSDLGKALADLNADTLDLIAKGLDGLAASAGPLALPLTTAADAMRLMADGYGDLSDAFANLKSDDYGAALLDIANGAAKLATATMQANFAIVAFVGSLLLLSISQSAATAVHGLANDLRKVAAEGHPAAGALTTYADSLDTTSTAQDRLRSAFDNFKRGNYKAAFEDVGNGIAGLVVAAQLVHTSVVQAFADMVLAFIKWISKTAEVKKAWSDLKGALAGAWSGVENSGVYKFLVDVIDKAKEAIDWLNKIPGFNIDGGGGGSDSGAMDPKDPNAPWNDPRRYEPSPTGNPASESAVGTVNNGVRITTLPAVGSGPQGFVAQTKGLAEQVANIVGTMAAQVATGLQKVVSSFQQTGQQSGAALQQLRGQVQQVFGQIAQTSAQQAQQMQQRVTSSFQQMASQSTNSANQMRGSVGSAMQGMASQGVAAMNQFAGGVQSGFGRAVAAAHSGVSQIRGAVSGLNLYGQGYSIGASLGQGIASGIQAYIGTVASAAAALVNNAVAAARSAAAARSPSRKMMALGGDMAEGLTLGIERGAASVAAATAGLIGIPDAMGAGTGSAPIVNNYYAVTPEDLKRLLEESSVGAKFARGFGQQVGLYSGTI